MAIDVTQLRTWTAQAKAAQEAEAQAKIDAEKEVGRQWVRDHRSEIITTIKKQAQSGYNAARYGLPREFGIYEEAGAVEIASTWAATNGLTFGCYGINGVQTLTFGW